MFAGWFINFSVTLWETPFCPGSFLKICRLSRILALKHWEMIVVNINFSFEGWESRFALSNSTTKQRRYMKTVETFLAEALRSLNEDIKAMRSLGLGSSRIEAEIVR